MIKLVDILKEIKLFPNYKITPKIILKIWNKINDKLEKHSNDFDNSIYDLIDNECKNIGKNHNIGNDKYGYEHWDKNKIEKLNSNELSKLYIDLLPLIKKLNIKVKLDEIKLIGKVSPKMVLELWEEIFKKYENNRDMYDVDELINILRKYRTLGLSGREWVPLLNNKQLSLLYNELLNLNKKLK